MNSHPSELFSLAQALNDVVGQADDDAIKKPLAALEKAAQDVGRAFSGSWLGYHSRVYYAEFKPPPPGAHFSQEWGLMGTSGSSFGSRGDWQEYAPEEVAEYIEEVAGHPDLTPAPRGGDAAVEIFESSKTDLLSILTGELAERPDTFLQKLEKETEQLLPLSVSDVVNYMSPQGKPPSRVIQLPPVKGTGSHRTSVR